MLSWAFWLGLLEAVMAFVKSHLWIVGLALLVATGLMAVYLPGALYRAIALMVFGFIAFVLGLKASDVRLSELL